jgi:hypothetical protein
MKTYAWTGALLAGVLATVLLTANVARADGDAEPAEPVTQKQYVRAVQLRYASLFISGAVILAALAYALTKLNQSLKRDHDIRRKQAMTAPDDDYTVQGLSTGAMWVSKPPDPEPPADKTPPLSP